MPLKLRVVALIVAGVLLTAGRAAALEAGVVVEAVDRHSAAQQAGIQRGDVLRAWTRGDARGEIRSPFNVSAIEMEQGPLGRVTIEGIRQAQRRTWVIEAGRWGLRSRPELAGRALSSYKRCRDLEARGTYARAAVECGVAADSEKGSSADATAWLTARAAQMWARARRWKEVDEAYPSAINASPAMNSFLSWEWAKSFQQRHDWEHAISTYERAIAESEQAGARLTAAAIADDLGMMSWMRADLKRAEQYCRKALETRSQMAPGSLAQAQSLISVGTVVRYSRGPGLQEGEQYYGQALEIAERVAPGGLDVSAALRGLGIIAWQRGNLAHAQGYLRRALEIETKVAPGGLEYAYTLNELATVADLQGNRPAAKNYLLRALAIRRKKSPNSWDVSQSIHDLGLLAQESGDLKSADRFTQKALKIDQGLMADSLDVAGDLNDLSYIAHDRGDLAQAEKYQQEALAIEEKVAPGGLYVAETLHALADMASQRGDSAAAQGYYERALAIREVLDPGSEDHAATLAGLAAVLKKKGDLAASAKSWDQTIGALESQTERLGGSDEVRSDFRARHAEYYRRYVDVLLAENHPDAALEVLERSRARMLLEMMAGAHVDLTRDVDSRLLGKERRLQAELAAKTDSRLRLLSGHAASQQISAVQAEISQLLAQHEEVQGEIRASNPRYAELTQPQAIGARQIQELLDGDTLLLEYSLGEERSHVWLVSADALASYELPKRSEIEAAARSVYELLTVANRVVKGESEARRNSRLERAGERFEVAAAALSRMILGPVAGQLGNKRLLVVRDGALQYIPFSALPVLAANGAKNEVVPLMVEHEVVSVPSMAVLAALRREEATRSRAPKAVAVLADPVFDKDDVRVGHGAGEPLRRGDRDRGAFWSSLPASRLLRSASDVGLLEPKRSAMGHELHLSRLWFTRLEAESILAAAPRGLAMKALDFKASRATATSEELSQYRIVHFATHGLVDSRNPELSGLVLSMVDAEGKPQNGFLDLQDIYNLRLPVDMVVLSACETGLGKEIDGEGLVGLTQGFMYAGASRVVASLWRVSDVATAQLMGEFYRAMEYDGKRPAAALREAQIKMWKQKRWASPYYWAGFQIQGEWN